MLSDIHIRINKGFLDRYEYLFDTLYIYIKVQHEFFLNIIYIYINVTNSTEFNY